MILVQICILLLSIFSVQKNYTGDQTASTPHMLSDDHKAVLGKGLCNLMDLAKFLVCASIETTYYCNTKLQEYPWHELNEPIEKAKIKSAQYFVKGTNSLDHLSNDPILKQVSHDLVKHGKKRLFQKYSKPTRKAHAPIERIVIDSKTITTMINNNTPELIPSISVPRHQAALITAGSLLLGCTLYTLYKMWKQKHDKVETKPIPLTEKTDC